MEKQKTPPTILFDAVNNYDVIAAAVKQIKENTFKPASFIILKDHRFMYAWKLKHWRLF